MTENQTENPDAEYQADAMSRALVEVERVRETLFDAYLAVGNIPLARLSQAQEDALYQLWGDLRRAAEALAEDAAGLGAKAPEEVSA